MKRMFLSILFMLLIPNTSFSGQYRVLDVVDGDTIDIAFKGRKERIRMLNVNTPESVHPDQSKNTRMGKMASNFTRTRLGGREVDLVFEGRDRGKYGRLLAYVFVDGKNFCVELVRKGWSPYYTKYGSSQKYHTEFKAAQAMAQKERLGIWGAVTASQQKAVIQETKVTGGYQGNVSSRKFHRPGCRYYNCKKCTRLFANREDAIASGYLPCKVCKP